MTSRTPRRGYLGLDPVAGLQPQAVDPLVGDVDAVAVLTDEVSVAVGMDMQKPLLRVSPALSGRGGLSALAVQIHEQKQHVGEIHHQADRHGDQQVQHHFGIFRLQFHRWSFLDRGLHPAERAATPSVWKETTRERRVPGDYSSLYHEA